MTDLDNLLPWEPLPETANKPKELPRLSPSIAKIAYQRSWLHAWQAHRLLGGGDGDSEETKAQATGKILEALVFGAGLDKFVIVEADDFRTKAAREQKEDAQANGKTAILIGDYAKFRDASLTITSRLRDQGIVFNGGEYQKKVEWTDGETGANCKGFLDYFSDGIIWDFKTTSDASPRKIVRQFVDMGYDIQYAAYTDGIESTIPALVGRSRFLFAYAETEPPYAVQVYEPDGMMKALGKSKWDWAKLRWAENLAANEWPGYFSGIGQLTPLPWQMTDVEIETEVKE